MSALGVVLALLPARGGWRNGRRARFRSVCPKGREGSNPSSPTRQLVLFAGRWPASRWSAALVRGGDPPEPPAWRTLWLWFLAVGQVATVARGRVWFLPLAGCRPYVGSRGRVWDPAAEPRSRRRFLSERTCIGVITVGCFLGTGQSEQGSRNGVAGTRKAFVLLCELA